MYDVCIDNCRQLLSRGSMVIEAPVNSHFPVGCRGRPRSAPETTNRGCPGCSRVGLRRGGMSASPQFLPAPVFGRGSLFQNCPTYETLRSWYVGGLWPTKDKFLIEGGVARVTWPTERSEVKIKDEKYRNRFGGNSAVHDPMYFKYRQLVPIIMPPPVGRGH